MCNDRWLLYALLRWIDRVESCVVPAFATKYRNIKTGGVGDSVSDSGYMIGNAGEDVVAYRSVLPVHR